MQLAPSQILAVPGIWAIFERSEEQNGASSCVVFNPGKSRSSRTDRPDRSVTAEREKRQT